MAKSYTCRRRIEFADTDMAGIVRFSSFFRFMEEAEAGFWRSLGLSMFGGGSGDPIGWPKVRVSCEYFRPVGFEDVLEIEVRVAEIGRKSLRFEFRFRESVDDSSAESGEVARGEVKVACVPMKRDGKLAAIPIPEAIREKLEGSDGGE